MQVYTRKKLQFTLEKKINRRKVKKLLSISSYQVNDTAIRYDGKHFSSLYFLPDLQESDGGAMVGKQLPPPVSGDAKISLSG